MGGIVGTLLALVLALGCGGREGGGADAAMDAASSDGGPRGDGSRPDASDAFDGGRDAGPDRTDAGDSPDAGTTSDAGASDAGPTDSGVGTVDAGTEPPEEWPGDTALMLEGHVVFGGAGEQFLYDAAANDDWLVVAGRSTHAGGVTPTTDFGAGPVTGGHFIAGFDAIGTPAWYTIFDADVRALAIDATDRIYAVTYGVAAGHALVVLDATDGSELRREEDFRPGARPELWVARTAGGTAIGYTVNSAPTDIDSEILVIDDDGTTRWTRTLSNTHFIGPAIQDLHANASHVYVRVDLHDASLRTRLGFETLGRFYPSRYLVVRYDATTGAAVGWDVRAGKLGIVSGSDWPTALGDSWYVEVGSRETLGLTHPRPALQRRAVGDFVGDFETPYTLGAPDQRGYLASPQSYGDELLARMLDGDTHYVTSWNVAPTPGEVWRQPTLEPEHVFRTHGHIVLTLVRETAFTIGGTTHRPADADLVVVWYREP